jgi:hypothetical protein
VPADRTGPVVGWWLLYYGGADGDPNSLPGIGLEPSPVKTPYVAMFNV